MNHPGNDIILITSSNAAPHLSTMCCGCTPVAVASRQNKKQRMPA
jgi:hypothetical protein